MNHFHKLLKTISEAPVTQIYDKKISERIGHLIGCNREIVIHELKEIRDLCVEKHLATEFAIMILNQSITVAETSA